MDRSSSRPSTARSPSLSDRAFHAYQTGQFVEAEWICQDFLRDHPKDVTTLNLLGAIAAATGRPDTAIAQYQRVIAFAPDHAEAHGNLAVVLQARGKWKAAKTHFEKSLKLNPNAPVTHFNFGNWYLQQQKYDPAIAHYEHAISLQPNYPTAYYNLGQAMQAIGRLDLALDAFQNAIELDPNFADAYNNVGSTLQALHHPEIAVPYYQKALMLRSTPAGYYNLGNAYRELLQYDDAIAAYQTAIQLDPTQPNRDQISNNLGIALREGDRPHEAVMQFQQAIAHRPNYPEAYSNLGITLQELNDFTGAIAAYEKAVELDPKFPQGHANLGMALLAIGEFARGWHEYEWRWLCDGDCRRRLPQPLWDGSNLDGKRILIYAEQGYGDAIQFIRYLPFLVEQGARVMVECQPNLLRLLQQLPDIEQIISAGNPLPDFDVHLPLLSLPDRLRLAEIPRSRPYLHAPHSLTIPETSNLKVGIVWASGYRESLRLKRLYHIRTIALPTFMAIQSVPNVSLYSLQVGPHEADIATHGFESCIHNLAPQIQDFADTAAAIAQLDLILSVDTAVAHLAGAMGKPVWNLLPFSADWRWRTPDTTQTDWYPTMRLFRQPQPHDWESVMRSVIQFLHDWRSSL